jgi:hypothetical protein
VISESWPAVSVRLPDSEWVQIVLLYKASSGGKVQGELRS